ncbi:hypothetical protein ES705_02141 [subsurface metagenome]
MKVLFVYVNLMQQEDNSLGRVYIFVRFKDRDLKKEINNE